MIVSDVMLRGPLSALHRALGCYLATAASFSSHSPMWSISLAIKYLGGRRGCLYLSCLALLASPPKRTLNVPAGFHGIVTNTGYGSLTAILWCNLNQTKLSMGHMPFGPVSVKIVPRHRMRANSPGSPHGLLPQILWRLVHLLNTRYIRIRLHRLHPTIHLRLSPLRFASPPHILVFHNFPRQPTTLHLRLQAAVPRVSRVSVGTPIHYAD